MNEEIKEKCKILEQQLNELTDDINNEILANMTKEEKKEYLKILAEIKTKIEILKSYN
ncbi:MAG: hypothetical protein ACI4UE_02380 [Candidatus Scatovivens sp.]